MDRWAVLYVVLLVGGCAALSDPRGASMLVSRCSPGSTMYAGAAFCESVAAPLSQRW